MRIVFVGGGNMASALIGGLVARGHACDRIAAVERDAAQAERLSARFGVTTRDSIDAAAADGLLAADVLVLAVKPQQMREVAAALAPHLGSAAAPLVLSIAAGVRMADLACWLGGATRIVRTMPNTPALIGAGITALVASAHASNADRAHAEAIMDACGQTLWVADESLLDAVTAVSGSGPAYVFYFMEAMQAAACELGLTDEQARRLTLATFSGAAQLAAQSEDAPSMLRERVTSKGGTTAAALAHLQSHDAGRLLAEAIRAAHRRSVELGDELSAPATATRTR